VAPLFTQADDSCDVYVDVRTAPGADEAVLATMAAALADLPFACDLNIYDRETGHIAAGADALVEAIELAHGLVFESPPGPPRDAQVSMWHDTNAFNAAGIPAVSYGIAPRPEAYTRERIRSATIDDIVRLAHVYALTALRLCGPEAPSSPPDEPTRTHGDSAPSG
jgi:acetylornithine deacetylase/succinyl-diaminopimelate desuccinylase-like protein